MFREYEEVRRKHTQGWLPVHPHLSPSSIGEHTDTLTHLSPCTYIPYFHHPFFPLISLTFSPFLHVDIHLLQKPLFSLPYLPVLFISLLLAYLCFSGLCSTAYVFPCNYLPCCTLPRPSTPRICTCSPNGISSSTTLKCPLVYFH